MGRPTVFPTGTTIYEPSACENGYTLFVGPGIGPILINMNGKVVHYWKNVAGMPCKMLRGGYIFGSLRTRLASAATQDIADVSLIDWDGNVLWSFDHNEFVNDPDGDAWVARQHHDYQVDGNPVGYPVPGMESTIDFENMLVLTHRNVRKPRISPQLLLEDRLIEIDREGNITWEWCMLDHFNELGLSELAKNTIYRNPTTKPAGPEGEGDIFHVNCASYLGPNHWYDEGDERFNPRNIIMDSREGNFLFIVSRETGEIVWQVGPDFTTSKELRLLGTVVGPHHTHMIPKGLPGEGNIMVYDNGGWAGYGAPTQVSKQGLKVTQRDGSRVLEFNPVTLETVWECTGEGRNGFGSNNVQRFKSHYFYSPLTSDAQRLPNGNTFICEGTSGRFMEFTPDGKLVWEYLYPRVGEGLIHRAYRIPYDWVPQLPQQEEVAIGRISNEDLLMPGAAKFDLEGVGAEVEGAQGFKREFAHCVDKVE